MGLIICLSTYWLAVSAYLFDDLRFSRRKLGKGV